MVLTYLKSFKMWVKELLVMMKNPQVLEVLLKNLPPQKVMASKISRDPDSEICAGSHPSGVAQPPKWA